jgi:acetolactate synthase-1/3 small subunit
VGITDNPEFSKMTITTSADEKQVTQIIKQLDKMIDTIEVKRLDEKMSVYRELVLMKIKVTKPSDSMEIMNLANAFECKVHDVRRTSIMVEITATPDRINAFQDLVREYGILDIARTGVCAIPRGGIDES